MKLCRKPSNLILTLIGAYNMSYDNTNRGSIWRNDKKEKDTHPDFTGSLNVEGVEYQVSAWKRKEGANPKSPALSFSIKPKESKQQNKPAQSQHDSDKANGYQPDDFDDSTIPF